MLACLLCVFHMYCCFSTCNSPYHAKEEGVLGLYGVCAGENRDAFALVVFSDTLARWNVFDRIHAFGCVWGGFMRCNVMEAMCWILCNFSGNK